MTHISNKTPAMIKGLCDEVGQCWIWRGGVDGHGRPQMRHGGKSVYVRRTLRGMVDGKPVPANMVTPSECGCMRCVSPHCSIVATQRTATQMAAARGAYSTADKVRKVIATKRARSHITDEKVARIRSADGPATRISTTEGVSVSHVKAIRRGTARRDYTSPFAGLMA